MKFKFLKLTTALLFCSKCLLAQWETVYPSFGPNLPWLNAVEFRDFNNGFAVGTTGHPCILKTTDNGTTWDTVFTSVDTMQFNDVTFSDSLTAFAVADRQGGWNPNFGMITRTTDFGMTWTTTYTNFGLTSVCFPSPSIGYAAGNFGAFFKTTNAGVTWTQLSTGSSLMIKEIHFVNDTVGFACGFDTAFVNDSILKTTDGGITWSCQSIAPGIHSGKLSFPSDSIGYCFTDGNKIYKTIDQGNTWSLITTLPNHILPLSFFFADTSTGYLAGPFFMLNTSDGGVTWNYQNSSPGNFSDDVMDVNFLNRDTGFCVGNGQFYRTSNGGVTSVSSMENNKNEISVFPNPTNGNFEISGNFNSSSRLHIYNLLGEEVCRAIDLPEGNQKIPVDLKLAEGIYIYRIISETKILYEGKIVITNQ